MCMCLVYDKECLKLVAKRFYNHANEAAQDGLLVSQPVSSTALFFHYLKKFVDVSSFGTLIPCLAIRKRKMLCK